MQKSNSRFKIAVTIIILCICHSAAMNAQSNLNQLIIKGVEALERRYHQQTEKERKNTTPNHWNHDEKSPGNFEDENGICYECRLSNHIATVTDGIEKWRVSYSMDDKWDDMDKKEIDHHSSISNIHIPDYVNFIETDKDFKEIGRGKCSVIQMVPGAFKGSLASSAWITGNIGSIPPYSFANSKIGNLTLNYGTTCIEEQAFKGCTNLRNLVLPESLQVIRSEAFSDCSSLKQINLPDNVKYIGEYCFRNCSQLGTIRLPSNLSSMEEGLFIGCGILQIHIPPTVKILGNHIFGHNGDSNTQPINSPVGILFVYSHIPPICTPNTFDGINLETCTIFVPEDAIEEYKNAYGWNQFKHIERLETLSSIAIYPF